MGEFCRLATFTFRASIIFGSRSGDLEEEYLRDLLLDALLERRGESLPLDSGVFSRLRFSPLLGHAYVEVGGLPFPREPKGTKGCFFAIFMLTGIHPSLISNPSGSNFSVTQGLAPTIDHLHYHPVQGQYLGCDI